MTVDLEPDRATLTVHERRLVNLGGRLYHWTRPPGGKLRLKAGFDPESMATMEALRVEYELLMPDGSSVPAVEIDGDLRTSADGSPSSDSPSAGEPERATSGESAPILP